MEQVIKFKKGDVLRCKPGFKREHGNWEDSTSGGSGYEEGKIITVHAISSGDPVVWPEMGEGIFQQALELVTPTNQFENYEIY